MVVPSFVKPPKGISSLSHVMKPAQEKIEKIDQRLRIQPLRGGKPPLHYINEQFLDDTNEKTSFLYIGV